MAWCSPSLFAASVQVSKSKGKVLYTPWDSACPEEIAAGIDRKERKYYYSSLTDGKPRRRELKRLAKSQTEIWKQPGTESRSAETQASALITRLLIVIVFLQLLFTRIDYEISAFSYSYSAPTASFTPHVIPLPFFPPVCVKKSLSSYSCSGRCSAKLCLHLSAPALIFLTNKFLYFPTLIPFAHSFVTRLKAPQLSAEPSHGCSENLPDWDAQSPGKEEFVGIPTDSSPKPGHRPLHTAQSWRSLSKELMQILSYPSQRGVLHTSGMMGETIYRYSVMSINALYKLFPFYWL